MDLNTALNVALVAISAAQLVVMCLLPLATSIASCMVVYLVHKFHDDVEVPV